MEKIDKEAAGASENKASEKKKMFKRYTISHIFADGAVADMVYSKLTEEAGFAVSKEGGVSLQEELMVGKDGNLTLNETEAMPGRGMVPSKEARRLAEERLVCLPSGIEEYGTSRDLFDEVRAFIEKYVVLEDSRFYDVTAGYVLMTWVFDRFSVVPYLRVVGDLGTGKSRFLEVVGKLCNRAIMASGSMSMPAVYRSINAIEGTLVFDEADFKSSDMTSDLAKILNGGHKKDTPVVKMETVNEQLRLAVFRVFGPKLFGSRHGFEDDALNSRCIIQRFFPLADLKGTPIHLPQTFEAEAQTLRNKLLMFRMKNHRLMQDDESTVESISFPRLKQTALALTSVAKTIGDEALESITSFLMDGEQDLLNSVSADEHADILLCIAWLIETDEEVRSSGQLLMKRIAKEFNERFYDDYATRATRRVEGRDKSVLEFPGQVVSPRKIGVYVDQLGLSKERSSRGLFVPIHKEAQRIDMLVKRYKLVEIIEERKVAKVEVPHTRSPEIDFEEDKPQPH